MKTIHIGDNLRLNNPCVATIGCFDGIHRGHRLLIGMVLAKAKAMEMASMVITFDRQPRELFDPSFHPQLLSTLDEKESMLEDMGVDTLVVLPFTSQLASMTAQDFMQQVLCKQLGVKVLITGYDNRFGHNRSEGFEDYVRYGKEMDMEVIQGEEEVFPETSEAISSSAIRQLLLEGDVALASEALYHPYALQGIVVPGEHIGHELGFPTANIDLGNSQKLIPAPGVYAVWAIIDGERMPAMMNIGTRPTFDGSRQTLEVHILDKVGDMYGQQLKVEFVSRLRKERRFKSREALVRQLEADRNEATIILKK